VASVTLGFPEVGGALELCLLTAQEFQGACHLYSIHPDDGAFTVFIAEPGRSDPDARIYSTPDTWTLERATHELMHGALHVASLRQLDLAASSEQVPGIAGEFMRLITGTPFEPRGSES